MLYELIKLVHVDIAKELAGQVTDGQTGFSVAVSALSLSLVA